MTVGPRAHFLRQAQDERPLLTWRYIPNQAPHWL